MSLHEKMIPYLHNGGMAGRRPKDPSGQALQPRSYKWPNDVDQAIAEAARSHGVTRTDYLIGLVLADNPGLDGPGLQEVLRQTA